MGRERRRTVCSRALLLPYWLFQQVNYTFSVALMILQSVSWRWIAGDTALFGWTERSRRHYERLARGRQIGDVYYGLGRLNYDSEGPPRSWRTCFIRRRRVCLLALASIELCSEAAEEQKAAPRRHSPVSACRVVALLPHH